MSGFVRLAGDAEVMARLPRVEALLRHVCDDEEFPYFVSDEATVYDVCTESAAEIRRRLRAQYPAAPDELDLDLPIWQLVDVVDPDRPDDL